jgi:DNA processing protein
MSDNHTTHLGISTTRTGLCYNSARTTVEERHVQVTDQTPYWISLSRVAGIGPARMRLLLDYFGSAESAWNATVGDLFASGLDAKSTEALLAARRTSTPDVEIERLESIGASVLTWESEVYPERLREVADAPPVLYVLGEITAADAWAVAVVGTRRATSYGREVAARLSSGLAEAGVSVVSGLAKGVDTVAHNAALDAGGRTIAVLGSGIDVIYPAENRNLARRIVEEGRGGVVSDYPPGTQPDAMNFPPRNRIIAGLSLGVLVVEAGEKSGALITATFALDQGREVFAVPRAKTHSAAVYGVLHYPRSSARGMGGPRRTPARLC